MNAHQASELLSKMTYKPGTSVEAWGVGRGDNTVFLKFAFDSWDSTPRPGGYHEQARFGSPPITIDVSGLDAVEVAGAGLIALEQVEQHETREFWRLAHGMAPFHPHNKSGVRAWEHVRTLRNRVRVSYPEPDGA
jgi:hypothetical protein